MSYSFAILKPTYTDLWAKMEVNIDAKADLEETVANITKGIAQYLAVEKATGVHWKFIGIIHSLECDCRFDEHLHNGDPLTARTVHVPAGRPLTGNPPFTWHDSAVDALNQMGLSGANDWSIEGTLYHLEQYNGFGYRSKGINSPYLWSGSNLYTKGKFGSDNQYNPDLVSKQTGAALILKYLIDP